MDLHLNGKAAVITGSGRGIGYASALTLAQEGARIVIADINPDAVAQAVYSLRAAGHEVIGAVLDVCDNDQVQAKLCRRSAVSISWSTAGFTRDNYLLKMPVADWDAVVDTILKGAYHCTLAALPTMMQHRWGRVINIVSRAHWGDPGQANYAAAKAGLIGFTRALEQGKFNITANAIAPGLVETPLVRGLATYEKIKINALAHQPIQRLGAVEDIAHAVAFLASDRASFITGELLHVTGGRYAS